MERNKGYQKLKEKTRLRGNSFFFLSTILLVDAFLIGLCISVALQERNMSVQAAVQKAESGVRGEKYLALTFDDGPDKDYTKRLLEGLRERGVKASFFLVGENIDGNEELLSQMTKDGHLVGTHCLNHVDLTKKSIEESCRDIWATNEKIQAVTGRYPEYIRPPYGIWSEELEECVGMTPVFWDIDPLDWQVRDAGQIVEHIRKNVKKHQIILLHDTYGTSVDAALAVVDVLGREGYVFVTVDELLID